MLFNNLKYSNDESKIVKSSKCVIFLAIFSHVLFFISIFSYIVCSVAFLIADSHIGTSTDSCYIWYSVLAYLLLLLIKLFLIKYECYLMKVNFSNMLIHLSIEICFIVSGLNMYYDDTCVDLNETNLMYVFLTSLIIQFMISIVYAFLVIIFIMTELCKIKTPCCCID